MVSRLYTLRAITHLIEEHDRVALTSLDVVEEGVLDLVHVDGGVGSHVTEVLTPKDQQAPRTLGVAWVDKGRGGGVRCQGSA